MDLADPMWIYRIYHAGHRQPYAGRSDEAASAPLTVGPHPWVLIQQAGPRQAHSPPLWALVQGVEQLLVLRLKQGLAMRVLVLRGGGVERRV